MEIDIYTMLYSRVPAMRQTLACSLRMYSSVAAEPCTYYLTATHSDDSCIPAGSKLENELARFKETTLGTYVRPPVIFTHGKGLDLYAKAAGVDGKETTRRYLDFTAGIAVNSLGHADDTVARLAGEQAATLVHASNLYYNNWSGHLAEKLASLTRAHGGVGFPRGSEAPPGGDLRIFLCNSGTEANEGSLRLTSRTEVCTESSDGA